MRIRYGVISACFLCLILAAPAWSQHTKEELDLLLHRHLQFHNNEVVANPSAIYEPLLRQKTASPAVLRDFLSVDAIQAWLLMQQLYQLWDLEANGGAGGWIDESRYTYTRNDDGYVTALLIEEWDPAAEKWVNSIRITDALDDQNRTIESISEDWDPEANSGTGDWVPMQRSTHSYNAQGRMLVSSAELWMEDTQEYELNFRTTSSYDGSGERELVRLFEWALFGPIEPYSRQTFTYYNDGNVAETLVESHFAGTWMNSELRLHAYDENNHTIEEIVKVWDPAANGGAGDWVNSFQVLTTYAPTSNDPSEITVTDQVWDPAANDGQGGWMNDTRAITQVDSEGNLEEYTQQSWDSDLGDWVNKSRSTAEYDDRGLAIVYLDELWMEGEWANASRLLMTYEESDPTASEETPIRLFDLGPNYPNPFTEETTISYSLVAAGRITIEVFDVLGRHVATLVDAVAPAGSHSVTFESGDLAGGLYVFRLRGTSVQTSRTMLIVK